MAPACPCYHRHLCTNLRIKLFLLLVKHCPISLSGCVIIRNVPTEFQKYIAEDKTILIICSRPLDFDSICSGLVLKKYLESLKKLVTLVFPKKLKSKQKKYYEFLPYFNELKDIDTRKILKRKTHDLLILIDGVNLIQFYDTEKTKDNPPDLNLYPRRIRVDHHLNSPENLGTFNVHQPQTSSTAELILEKIVPVKFIDKQIATLGYIAMMQDTGNFSWNFYASTLKTAGLLLEKGADPAGVMEKLYFSFSKLHFEMLVYAIENMVYQKSIGTIFLFLPNKKRLKDKITEEKLSELKDVFLWDVARRIENYPRGFFLYEKHPGKISGSGRGNNSNHINLPELIKEIGGNGGGHFNAAGFEIEGNFSKIKKLLLNVLKKSCVSVLPPLPLP